MKDIFDVEIKVGDVVAFVRKYNRYFDLQKGKVVKTTPKMVFVEYYDEQKETNKKSLATKLDKNGNVIIVDKIIKTDIKTENVRELEILSDDFFIL